MPKTLPPPVNQPATPQPAIEQALVELREGAGRLAKASLQDRIECVRSSLRGVSATARQWVEIACRAKGIPIDSAARAEEILVGPVSVARYLQLMIGVYRDLQEGGCPRLPAPPRLVRGQLRVPTFPTRLLYDSLTFRSIRAETWLQPEADPANIFGTAPDRLARRRLPSPRVCLVLGAGNVSAIPATDALTNLLQNDCAVLLKMNHVNDYLGPLFERALQPFIQAQLLRIVYGDADVGHYAVHHPLVDTIHITGSAETHDMILWGPDGAERRERQQAGRPLVNKPVTSELGNVTPWAVVPGAYSEAQLRSQAENVAASIINNASFNCIATKVIITWRDWPDRQRFLDLVESILQVTPTRFAYYPGAVERYKEYSGGAAGPDSQGRLPWMLRRDVNPVEEPRLFERESFVCVAAETALEAASPEDFLERAVQFMNERLWGTLAAAVTVPEAMTKRGGSGALDANLGQLRYGTIGVNLWPGIGYALMSPPWGAYPGGPLTNIGSGRGHVHNTYLLDQPQKTVLRAPLRMYLKPIWFSTHRRPEAMAWRLLKTYCRPTLGKLPALLGDALRG